MQRNVTGETNHTTWRNDLPFKPRPLTLSGSWGCPGRNLLQPFSPVTPPLSRMTLYLFSFLFKPLTSPPVSSWSGFLFSEENIKPRKRQTLFPYGLPSIVLWWICHTLPTGTCSSPFPSPGTTVMAWTVSLQNSYIQVLTPVPQMRWPYLEIRSLKGY